MSDQPDRICILGGGFAGLYTALNLSQLPWQLPNTPDIVLVDQRDRFLFSPFLYELLTGELQTWEISPPFVELLADTNVRFQQAAVAGINLDEQTVYLHDSPELSYTQLVLALGGETPVDFVPGADQHAIPFRTIPDAYRLEENLKSLERSDVDKIRIAIVGGGYSGVELACKLADRLGDRGRLRLIDRGEQILKTSPEFNRETATKALNERGVWVDLETQVTEIRADSISLEYKGQVDEIPVDIVLWTVGTKVADVIQTLPLKKNDRDQIVVTPALQAIDHPEIFALGDLADCRDASGQNIPATAQAAFQQAQYASWNIWASVTGRPLLPFRYQNLGEMMTLGMDNATLTGLGIKLDGPLAHIARRLAYLYRMPTFDHQVRVGLNWIAKPVRELLSP
ncbi:MAG TPA: NAD(P)/FAD-dependent oxidoreductase [Elainellaceae cyanobacterium]